MPVKQAKGAKGRADRYYSLIIRSIGYCEKCGTSEGLTTSHIVGRRYSATRTDLKNSQCLCFSCHRYFTDWPKEFSRWITQSIGTELYEELKQKAEAGAKINWDIEADRLKDIYKQITKGELTPMEVRK
jgi:hypothetical protein